MNIEQIHYQIGTYLHLEKTLDIINHQGFYNLFYTSFQSLHSQDNKCRTFEFKQCLKIILSELIDSIWQPISLPTPPSPPLIQRNNSITPTKSLQKSVNSCSNLNVKNHIVGSATFTKEKRSIHKEIPVTPGPSDYDLERAPNRSKSPTTIFPREKRNLDIAHKDSPGPSAYTPSIHFKSKF